MARLRAVGWDEHADFNGDEAINGGDFSLLVTNYDRRGPIPVTQVAWGPGQSIPVKR